MNPGLTRSIASRSRCPSPRSATVQSGPSPILHSRRHRAVRLAKADGVPRVTTTTRGSRGHAGLVPESGRVCRILARVSTVSRGRRSMKRGKSVGPPVRSGWLPARVRASVRPAQAICLRWPAECWPTPWILPSPPTRSGLSTRRRCSSHVRVDWRELARGPHRTVASRRVRLRRRPFRADVLQQHTERVPLGRRSRGDARSPPASPRWRRSPGLVATVLTALISISHHPAWCRTRHPDESSPR
jgi:hypothetical protein